MLIRLLQFTFVVLFISNVSGKDLPFVLPKNSPLIPKEHHLLPWIDFEGQVTIRAQFQFRHTDSDYSSSIDLYIYPDQEGVSNLPYLTLRGPDKATEIYVRNSLEIAKEIISKRELDLLKSGSVKFVSGWAIFKITDFAAGFECDSPKFATSILPQIKVESIKATGLGFEQNGC